VEAKPIIIHVSLFTFKLRMVHIVSTVSTLLFKQPVRHINNLISDFIFLLIQDDVSKYRSFVFFYKLAGFWQFKPYPCYISFLQNLPTKQCTVHFEKLKTVTQLVYKIPFFIEPACQYFRKKYFAFRVLRNSDKVNPFKSKAKYSLVSDYFEDD
jgi:hypothetical protein